MSDVVRSNGDILSWKSAIFRIENDIYEGLLAHDREEKRDRKVVPGARRDGTPLGKTGGKYEASPFTISVLRSTASKIEEQLCAISGTTSYGDAEFNFQAQYVEEGEDPVTMNAHRCHVVGKKESDKEGNEELMTDYTIQPLTADTNGRTLHSPVTA